MSIQDISTQSEQHVPINLVNLTKYYGSTRGIEDLNLSIKPGEIFGFLGQNGAGKTTTIRLILNILQPTEGQVEINGIVHTRHNPELKEEIGYLPGEINLPRKFRVEDLLYYIAALRSRSSHRMQELIDRFEVPMDKRFGELSKGNKQKVGIVLALMSDPAILILDEPTSGLDPIYQQILYDILYKEKLRGKTIFFSSHNLDEVQRICDRVAIIQKGRLVSVETVRELSQSINRVLSATFDRLDQAKIRRLKDRGVIIQATDIDANTAEFVVRSLEEVSKVLAMILEEGGKDISYPPASLETYFLTKYRADGAELPPMEG